MTGETTSVVVAREELAQFGVSYVPPSKRADHSKLIAAYVAAVIREDRARRTPAALPSLFDQIFGRLR